MCHGSFRNFQSQCIPIPELIKLNINKDKTGLPIKGGTRYFYPFKMVFGIS